MSSQFPALPKHGKTSKIRPNVCPFSDLRVINGFESHWRCHFFAIIVSNPCKKQSSAGKLIFRQRIFLFAVIFCRAKNGITHFTVGCRRFVLHSTSCEGGCAPALRRASPSSSNPNWRIDQVCIYKIDQARPSGVRDISRRHVCRWVAVASARSEIKSFFDKWRSISRNFSATSASSPPNFST